MKRVCIYGAGAVGSHLAVRAQLGGANVSLVARGPQLAAIRSHGLTLQTRGSEQNFRFAVAEDPGVFGVQDVVVVAVKTPALPQVARGLAPLLGHATRVVFVQNGVPWWYPHVLGEPGLVEALRLDPGGSLLKAVPLGRVLAAVVNAPVEVIVPGVVQVQPVIQRMTIGDINGITDPDALELAELFSRGGLPTEASDDIGTAVWNKLTAILMMGPMALITNSTYRFFLAEPVCRDAALAIGAEVGRVATALGSRPDPDYAARLEVVRHTPHRASILQDRLSGRAMEIDALLEAPRTLARFAGVATPTLDLIAVLARLAADDLGDFPTDLAETPSHAPSDLRSDAPSQPRVSAPISAPGRAPRRGRG